MRCTKAAEVQLTRGYLFGFALAQIFYGPLADRHARPVLLVAIGSSRCVARMCLAPSIEVLIPARFVQSIGGAGASVIARAVVRDRMSARVPGASYR